MSHVSLLAFLISSGNEVQKVATATVEEEEQLEEKTLVSDGKLTKEGAETVAPTVEIVSNATTPKPTVTVRCEIFGEILLPVASELGLPESFSHLNT